MRPPGQPAADKGFDDGSKLEAPTPNNPHTAIMFDEPPLHRRPTPSCHQKSAAMVITAPDPGWALPINW